MHRTAVGNDFPTYYDDYANVNFTAFIQKVIESQYPQFVAFKASDIENKCITIVSDSQMYCVVNDIRFEKDWIKYAVINLVTIINLLC